MHYSWDQIRTFHAVVNHGSLLAAARHLGLTQPTVGRHIDLLEEELGFSLFTRGRDGMKLTEKGTDLVPTAEEMIATARHFERVAAGLEERIEGRIRISANEIFGGILLPGIIAEFLVDHPMVEVEIDVSNQVSNLLRHDADIAIRMFRPTQNDLIARKVRDVPLGLFAHRDYLKRKGQPKIVSDLEGHVLIGQDRNPSMIDAYNAAGASLMPGDFQFRCDNNITQINAIRAGIGIGPLHLAMAEHWPDMIRVLPALQIPDLELWLACHADVRHNKRIRLVMDYLADRMKTPYVPLSV